MNIILLEAIIGDRYIVYIHFIFIINWALFYDIHLSNKQNSAFTQAGNAACKSK